jgi:hypothetical protein
VAGSGSLVLMRAPDAELIDDYPHALGGRLRGPAGPKADLLGPATRWRLLATTRTRLATS